MSAARLLPLSFKAVPGWPDDDHAAAFRAFLASAPAVIERGFSSDAACDPTRHALEHRLQALCGIAIDRKANVVSRSQARHFFEHFFVPHRLQHDGTRGLFTGYYEPIVAGSRTQTGRFRVPLYRRPPELETVIPDTERARAGAGLTHMRRTPAGLEPFPTRGEIEAGGLSGRGLELMWLADPVDAFFAQVQGSLRVRLPDGSRIGLTYDGKNGHPYTSIGRILIDRGEMPAAAITMQSLGAWLRADEPRGRALMQHNASFVFFREIDAPHAIGALGSPLHAGRSLAVDTSHHPLGLPIFVDAPGLLHWGRRRPFRRLMVAHDVGSAIRGVVRGDIYFGAGHRAESVAGITKHRGGMIVLLPRSSGAARGGDP